MKISVVVPVYNEEENIEKLYNIVSSLIIENGYDYEIIFVNDGSNDNSLSLLKSISTKDPKVKYISLSRNFGHQSAITAGFYHASGNAIISMDCDFQDPPELIPQMINEWQKGFKVVYARRRTRDDNFFKKYTAIWYYKILEKFSYLKIPKDIGDYRLIDQKVLHDLKTMNERARYIRGLIAWLGYDYSIIDFDRPKRAKGKTGFSIFKMMKFGMDGILSFSLLPLRLGLVIGLICILLGVGFLGYMSIDMLLNDVTYRLYKFLTVFIFILIGLLFIFIWILGEYIGRIHNEIKRRPIYIINEKSGNL